MNISKQSWSRELISAILVSGMNISNLGLVSSPLLLSLLSLPNCMASGVQGSTTSCGLSFSGVGVQGSTSCGVSFSSRPVRSGLVVVLFFFFLFSSGLVVVRRLFFLLVFSLIFLLSHGSWVMGHGSWVGGPVHHNVLRRKFLRGGVWSGLVVRLSSS